jgi:hypothetical protein
MENLKHRVKLMNLEDWIIFPGYLSHEQFITLLRNAYALVFPSLYEGFGMPILEAMAAGKPVLCSNVTSLPEIAGDAALVFDPRKPEEIARAMEHLEQTPELADVLIERGAARVAAFGNAETTAQKYIALFREAAATGSDDTYIAQGIYSDGWVGETMALTYETGAIEHTFQAEFHLPDFIRNQQINIVVSGSGFLNTYTLHSGKPIVIEQRLPPLSGAVEILFYPRFSAGGAEDKRSLTCQCGFMRIALPDHTLELFGTGA